MGLFTPYEERPPACEAVPVWFDTVDQIARYYSDAGYESSVTRRPAGIILHLAHEMIDEPGKYPHPGCDITVELDHELLNRGLAARVMLVYNHPPNLVDFDEFHRRYREVKEPG